MAEILTESFCERCGNRYTFQAATPRRQRLGKLKVLSKGLRNYVLSDTTTLDEAFAEARSDEERDLSSQQLDAFHQTFNFCMTCRQYTCANCWNTAEGRCLTCAPLAEPSLRDAFDTAVPPMAAGPGLEATPPPFAAPLPPFGGDAVRGERSVSRPFGGDSLATNGNGHELEHAWPTADLRQTGDAVEASTPVAADVDGRPTDEPAAAARPRELGAAAEPGVSDPQATERAATERAATERGGTEPGAAEPGGTEPAATDDRPLPDLLTAWNQLATAGASAGNGAGNGHRPTRDRRDVAHAPEDHLEDERWDVPADDEIFARLSTFGGAAAPTEPGLQESAATDVAVPQWPGVADAEPAPEVSPADGQVVGASAEAVEGNPAADSTTAEPVPPPTRTGATPDERAAAASERTRWLLGRFRPGQSLDEEIAAYEAGVATDDAVAVPSDGVRGRDEDPVVPAEAIAGTLDADVPLPEPASEPVAPPTEAGQPASRPAWELEPPFEGDVAASAEAATDGAAEPVVEPEPEPVAAFEPVAEPEPVAAVEPEAEPEAVAAFEPVAEPEPIAAVEPEAIAAVEVAPEPVAAIEPEAEPEPVAAVEPEAEPEAVAAFEPHAAAAVEPEPVASPAPGPEATTPQSLESPDLAPAHEDATLGTARDDAVAYPTWPVPASASDPGSRTPPPVSSPPSAPTAAPPMPPAPAIAAAAVPTTPPTTPNPTVPPPSVPAPVRPEPQWPATTAPSPAEVPPPWARPNVQPSWPQPAPVNLAGGGSHLSDRLWAESSRDVLTPSGAANTGVQACVSCGLPLSATARFCRRCGTRQS